MHGEEERARLVELVTRSVADFPWLTLPADEPPVVFERSKGRHAWYYSWWGLDTTDACLKDCRELNGFHAPERYCETGLGNGSDVLLIVNAPHTIPGVAATGGACAHGADGRPTAIVITWAMPLRELLHEPMDALVARHRGLVLHEVAHGLGWTWSSMRAADVIESRVMVDADGTSETAWVFRQGTQLAAVAAEHFNCSEPAVALMRHPAMGRDNHLPERIARQSLMSYGVEKRVDALSLAVFADLGHFSVRFEHAECVAYGRNAGCAWLASRCTAPAARDRSMVVQDAGECGGSAQWQANYDPCLDATCADGNDPCAGGAGYDAPSGRCDAQCVSPGTQAMSCVYANASLLARAYHRETSDDDWLGNDDAWLLFQVALLLTLAWGVGLALYATLPVSSYAT